MNPPTLDRRTFASASPLLLLATLALLALPALSQTQTSAVPDRISYQGIVSQAGGGLIGAGTPENRDVIFRIYSAATGGDIVYAERQTVTISDGRFSVLIGAGVAVGTEPGPSVVNLRDVFDHQSRYLGVTVAGSLAPAQVDPSTDSEISPRQRMVSTSFAIRAKEAESVIDGGITTEAIADDTVTFDKLTLNAVDTENIVANAVTEGKLDSGAVTSEKLAIGAVESANIGTDAVINAKIVAGAVTNEKLGPNAVNSAKIEDRSVQTEDLDHQSVTSNEIENSTIVGLDIQDETIKAEDLHDGSVTEPKLGINAVTTAKILNDAVTTAKIDDDAVTFEKLDPSVGQWTASAGNVFRASGRVGIGTNTPGYPLTVTSAGEATTNFGTPVSGFVPGDASLRDSFSVGTVSVRVEGGGVWSNFFVASSDRRIKEVRALSDGQMDLEVIEALRVKDYTMVDKVQEGTGLRKGLIAQEVYEIMPEAVTKGIDFIPDIYVMAETLAYDRAARRMRIDLARSHGLEAGDQVRIHADKRFHDLKVIAVHGKQSFSVASDSEWEEAFVFGREVDDFLAVDYDRIFVTAVSALQELKREKDAEVGVLEAEVTALKAEDARMKRRLADLEAKDRQRDARLAAFEKMLRAVAPPAQTASLKKVATAE